MQRIVFSQSNWTLRDKPGWLFMSNHHLAPSSTDRGSVSVLPSILRIPSRILLIHLQQPGSNRNIKFTSIVASSRFRSFTRLSKSSAIWIISCSLSFKSIIRIPKMLKGRPHHRERPKAMLYSTRQAVSPAWPSSWVCWHCTAFSLIWLDQLYYESVSSNKSQLVKRLAHLS